MLLGGALWGVGQLLSTLTYNGVSLSQAMTPAVANDGSVTIEWWDMDAPATGSHNIVANLTGSDEFLLLAWSFTGEHAVTPHGTCVGDGYTGSGSAHAHDTTCATDGFVAQMFAASQAIGTLTNNGGQTSRLAQTDVGSSLRVIASSKPGAATVNMGVDWTPSGPNFARWACGTVPIMPASARSLFRPPALSGVGIGGSFFGDPLQGARV